MLSQQACPTLYKEVKTEDVLQQDEYVPNETGGEVM